MLKFRFTVRVPFCGLKVRFGVYAIKVYMYVLAYLDVMCITNTPFSEHNKIWSKFGGIDVLIMFAYSRFICYSSAKRARFVYLRHTYVCMRLFSTKTEYIYYNAAARNW